MSAHQWRITKDTNVHNGRSTREERKEWKRTLEVIMAEEFYKLTVNRRLPIWHICREARVELTCWAWWYTPVSSALWEAEAGRRITSWRPEQRTQPDLRKGVGAAAQWLSPWVPSPVPNRNELFSSLGCCG